MSDILREEFFDLRHGTDGVIDHGAAALRDLAGVAGELIGLLRILGVLLHGRGDFLHRGRGLFQARRLFFGALGEIGRAGGNLGRGVGDLARGRFDLADNMRHRIDKAIDAGAQRLDLVGLAVERNALRQVVFFCRRNDLLGLLNGKLQRLAGENLRSDVGRIFNDLERLAAHVHDGVVTGLDPDFLAGFADPLVLTGIEFAAAKLLPEGAVFGAFAIGRFHEHAVMLAANFTERVAERFEKIVVGVEDFSVEREFDHGLRLADRGDLSLVIRVL